MRTKVWLLPGVGGNEQGTHMVGPPYLHVPHLESQPIVDHEYLKKKNLIKIKNMHRLFFLVILPQILWYNNDLRSIYMVS